MTTAPREEEAIRALAERLTKAHRTTRTPDEVAAAVADAHASFHGRPVRDFVPVLVERKARATLTHPQAIGRARES
ncbi:three-helix bundle dimerization domain-containing protein [Streptomyces sp. NPDC050264]|uniref:three-helix bundle dimerization domain-containing protein n=1 Tax=Streptomyces sp. NPDC050264 TaxID=3155038 RepID=UPI00343C7A96